MLRPVPDPGDERVPACPLGICEGEGWILREDGLAEECECLERRVGRARSRGMGTGIPKRFRGVSFDRRPICDIDRLHLGPVRAYVEAIERNLDEGRGMWFTGDVGTGKTSLAMLLALAAEKAGRSVAIYPVTRLLAEIKDTYDSQSSGSYMQLFRRLSSVDLLQLDDLGAERRTDWVLEQLYAIVNERWQDERSIVVTTNTLDLDALREQVGKPTVSRLLEICGEPLPIHGPDLRSVAPRG